MRRSFVRWGLVSLSSFQRNLLRAVSAALLLACGMALGLPLHAQVPNQITRPVDITEVRALSGHVPPGLTRKILRARFRRICCWTG